MRSAESLENVGKNDRLNACILSSSNALCRQESVASTPYSALAMPRLAAAVALLLITTPCLAQESSGTARGDRVMSDYLRAETSQLARDCLAEVRTLEDWTTRREEYRRQLLEMLGLDPLPEKTDLKPAVTGTRGASRVLRGEAALPVAARPVCDRQPLSAQRAGGAGAGDSLCLRPWQHQEGGHQLWQQDQLPASSGMVRPPRLCLPDHRHAAAWRDRGAAPRHVSRGHVVVAGSRLHAGRRRGLELRAGVGLSAVAAGGGRRSGSA